MSSYPTRDPSSEFAAAVQDYYAQKAEYNAQFQELLLSRSTNQDDDDQAEHSNDTTKKELVERPKPIHENNDIMPGDVKEDTAVGDITDQVAKDSKDSTASTHHLHDVDTGAKGGSGALKANVRDHLATPGPVKADNLPEPASKEDLKKRVEELNK